MYKVPTTREIAAACQCSQSTVSRALSNSAAVPKEKRERIQKIARDLGWRPNPYAAVYMAHLRSTRQLPYQANLAFIVSDPHGPKFTDLQIHLQKHYSGACARALELGYRVELVWLHEPGMTSRRLLRMLLNRNIPGLIVPKLIKEIPGFAQFEWKHFACAAMGYSFVNPKLHRVASHTSHGVHMVLNKARELGYEHIAVVVSETYDTLIDHAPLSAVYFQKYHANTGGKIDVYAFPKDDVSVIPGIQKWLMKTRPQVVVGQGITLSAIGGIGWRVPQDVAYISLDRASEFPEIAGFDQCHEVHGSMAVDLVVSQINHNERGIPVNPQYLLVEGRWADGLSAPPRDRIPKIKETVDMGQVIWP